VGHNEKGEWWPSMYGQVAQLVEDEIRGMVAGTLPNLLHTILFYKEKVSPPSRICPQSCPRRQNPSFKPQKPANALELWSKLFHYRLHRDSADKFHARSYSAPSSVRFQPEADMETTRKTPPRRGLIAVERRFDLPHMLACRRFFRSIVHCLRTGHDFAGISVSRSYAIKCRIFRASEDTRR